MLFGGICIITENVPQLTKFYEDILKTSAEGDYIHAGIRTEGAYLTIYSKAAAVKDMKFCFEKYCGTGKFTMEFDVEDVDLEYERLNALGVDFVTEPTTYPWGARAVHFRDPEGNIICFGCRCS